MIITISTLTDVAGSIRFVAARFAYTMAYTMTISTIRIEDQILTCVDAFKYLPASLIR